MKLNSLLPSCKYRYARDRQRDLTLIALSLLCSYTQRILSRDRERERAIKCI